MQVLFARCICSPTTDVVNIDLVNLADQVNADLFTAFVVGLGHIEQYEQEPGGR